MTPAFYCGYVYKYIEKNINMRPALNSFMWKMSSSPKIRLVKRKSSNLFQASDPFSHFILWQPHFYKHLRSALRCWSLLGQFQPTSPQFRPPSFQGKAFFRQALAELSPAETVHYIPKVLRKGNAFHGPFVQLSYVTQEIERF